MIFEPFIPLFVIYAIAILLAVAVVFCIIKSKYRKAKYFRRLAVIGLILVALVRPAVGTSGAERQLSNLNIFFVIDNTGSMVAQDMNDSKYRFEVVGEDMKKIVKLFPGSKFSITSLDYGINRVMPLINNPDTVISYINTLQPKQSTLSSDSKLSDLLDAVGEKIEKYSKRFPERSNILIFMTDGEEQDGRKINTPDNLRKHLSGGAIIGYGTTTGSKINLVSYSCIAIDQKSCVGKQIINESVYVKEPNTSIEHISKLNEDNLKQVASDLSLPYYNRNASDNKFDNVDNFAKQAAIYNSSDKNATVLNDLYWIPILFAITILFWDFYSILKGILLERKAAK